MGNSTYRRWRKILAIFMSVMLLQNSLVVSANETDVTEAPAVVEQQKEESKPEPKPQPVVEKQVDEPKAEEPKTEEPKKEEIKVEEPKTEELETENKEELEIEIPANVWTITFAENADAHGTICVGGSNITASSYKKELEDGAAFTFEIVPAEGYDVEAVYADYAEISSAGYVYTLASVTKNDNITVTYKENPEEPKTTIAEAIAKKLFKEPKMDGAEAFGPLGSV